MADLSRQPCYKAIQHYMDRITQIVIYDEVKDIAFAKELISLQDYNEYDRLSNIEAVRRMTMKVMRSIAGCERFLKILQEMAKDHDQYRELATLITDKIEQYSENTTEGAHAARCTCTAQLRLQEQLCSLNGELAIVSQNEVDEILQDGKALIDTLLKQEEKMQGIVKAMQLKRSAAKSFTDFLLYIIKLFKKAIENKTITLTNSVRQSITTELNDIFLVLHHVRKDFCSNQGDTAHAQYRTTQDDTTQAQDNPTQDNVTQGNATQDNADDTTSLDSSIALVVRHAIKMKDIIKSLQKKQWLRWLRSAKNISTFIPIFEKITKVVEGIQCIDCRPFCELLGDTKSLRDSLTDIETRILGIETTGLSASILLAIGSVVCLIVGGILIFTPAAPAAIPFAIAGAAGVGTSFVIGGSTKLCCFLTFKRLDHSKAKGNGKGSKFVKEDTTELDT